jgi:hypothetical protein
MTHSWRAVSLRAVWPGLVPFLGHEARTPINRSRPADLAAREWPGIVIFFYLARVGGVISGLNGEEKFLPVFGRLDIKAPIRVTKIRAAVPVLGEAFAHNNFAKSAKFTRPSIAHWVLLSLDRNANIAQTHDYVKTCLPIRGLLLRILRSRKFFLKLFDSFLIRRAS